MNALIASFPILMVIVTMLAFGLPAKRALPLGWLATFTVEMIPFSLLPDLVLPDQALAEKVVAEFKSRL